MIHELELKPGITVKIRPLSTTMLFAFLLSACSAQYTGWRPTIDTYDDPRAKYLYQDELDCQALAKRAAGSTPGKTAEGAGFGALGGAAAGAIIGAIAGDAGLGAAIGAASGALGGGAYRGLSSNEQYKSAYINCMRDRGHKVIN
jgi:Glycine-zipper domain